MSVFMERSKTHLSNRSFLKSPEMPAPSSFRTLWSIFLLTYMLTYLSRRIHNSIRGCKMSTELKWALKPIRHVVGRDIEYKEWVTMLKSEKSEYQHQPQAVNFDRSNSTRKYSWQISLVNGAKLHALLSLQDGDRNRCINEMCHRHTVQINQSINENNEIYITLKAIYYLFRASITTLGQETRCASLAPPSPHGTKHSAFFRTSPWA